jgi:hypothetical protein
MRNVAPYRARTGGSVSVGVDWGRLEDLHGLVAVGVLEDYGANVEAKLFVPFVETSRRLYADQVARIVELASDFDVSGIVAEVNGVGQPPVEMLADRLKYAQKAMPQEVQHGAVDDDRSGPGDQAERPPDPAA